ncbi:RNA polymerase sigma factor [Anaerotruncus rubiinfantis]|uniref:RNA polymerase sigma factor n=1 Tax=Anaerotruncus rubiinfantis TaxID=1720200 RepID=UPI0034A55BFA
MNNEELAIKAKGGDRDALTALYLNNQRLLYKLANKYRGIAQERFLDLEDLEQYAYLGLVRALKYFDSRNVMNVVREARGLRCSKEHQKQMDTISLDAPLPGQEDDEITLLDALENPEPSPAKRIENGELQEQLRAAIGALSPRQKEIIRLRYIDGMKLREIAERIGISYQGVLSAERHALEKLRKSLWAASPSNATRST